MEFELYYKLIGQCTSGKNAVIVTRSGHRFPAKRFVEWRRDALEQLAPQLVGMPIKLPITYPVSVQVVYTAKDRLRRDVPGIIDALWHLIEKAGIVSDDTFLAGWRKDLHFINRGVIKDEVGVELYIRGDYDNTSTSTSKIGKRRRSTKSNRSRKKIMGHGRIAGRL